MAATVDTLRQSPWRAQVGLISSFAVRDLKARFTATYLGLLWALIVPLATVLIYSTVFAVIFRAQAPPMGNGHAGVFAVWFFTGLVTWNIFAQASSNSLGSIVGMGAMLQKVYIPSYVPVAASSLTILMEKLLEASVMLLFLLVYQNIGWTWLLYPLVILCTGVLAGSLGYILSVANVYFRDTGQIYAIFLQLLFFLSPVIYPVDLIPEDWNGIPMRSLLALNPVGDLVEIGRDLLYELTLPSPWVVLYCLSWTIALVALAAWVYRRWGRDVGESV